MNLLRTALAFHALAALPSAQGKLLPTSIAPAEGWLDAPQVVLYGLAGGDLGLRQIGDIDGDGTPDVLAVDACATACLQPGLVAVLNRSPADLELGPTTLKNQFGIEEGQVFVLLGDLTGDGLPDVVTDSKGSTLATYGLVVYRNLGAGAFAPGTFVVTAQQDSRAGALGDRDGDGDLDLAQFYRDYDASEYRVRWWSWSEGTLSPGQGVSYGPTNASSITVAELTGDVRGDDVVGDWTNPEVRVFPTLSSGELGVPTILPIAGPGFGRDVSAGDLDGDGDDDVLVTWTEAVSGSVAYQMRALENLGGGLLCVGPLSTSPLLLGTFMQRAWLGDWDDDGDLDAGTNYEDLLFFEQTAPFVFELAADIPTAGRTFPPGALPGLGAGMVDWNRDGYLDFLADQAIKFGNGRFEDVGREVFEDISSSIGTFDLDSDGDLEVLSAFGSLWINHGRGNFTETNFVSVVVPPPPPGNYTVAPASLGDFSGDGTDDLLAAFGGVANTVLLFLEGDGMGRLLYTGVVGFNQNVGGQVELEPVDVDLDGDLDVLDSNEWWENAGAGRAWTLHGSAWVGFPETSSDVDLDGDVDVLVRDDVAQEFRLARNDGAGGFSPIFLSNRWQGSGTYPAPSADLVDLDGDGDADFVQGTSMNGGEVDVFENHSGAFPSQRGPISTRTATSTFSTNA